MGRRWVVFCAGLLCFTVSFITALWFSQSRIFDPPAPLDDGRISPPIDSGRQGAAAAAEQFYIGIHDQHVAIYKGKPEMGGVVVEITEIPIAKLAEFEIRNLRAGIPFADEEQKYSILEGLHFPL